MKKQAFNPILPLSEYIPDGEPHVFGDRVYLYGSHDKEGGKTFCMLDYEVWSAPVDDLGNWTSKGPNYSAKQDPLYSKKMKYMFAPDCVKGNDGRFYLYYCMAGHKGLGGYYNPVSVAVSDTPDGKFTYLGVVRNPDGSPLMRYVCFDPSVINDNGVIRLYYGTYWPWFEGIRFGPLKNKLYKRFFGRSKKQREYVPEGILGAYHVTLSDDMLTATSAPVRIDHSISGEEYKEHLFFEGSSMRKNGEKYYFIYSSINNHELCYAFSDKPDGGFQYGGTIVSNGDIGFLGRKKEDRLNHTGTNHGSMESINGKWYVFYHRLTHCSDYSRQACAEPVEIRPDGSIPQVQISSCGLNGCPLRAEGEYPAGICCILTNGKMTHGSNKKAKTKEPRVSSGDGERYISFIADNTLIGYRSFSFEGPITLSLRYRGKGEGAFEIMVDINGPVLSKIPICATKKWKDKETELPVPVGVRPLYFRYSGSGRIELLSFQLS
ncbi:MAG: family 43 glycosylhydrolase [Clostridiales bacterium]|nr:family 43 glycosylhydrolase [Clostridiales bacterium]MBR5040777.1 family 43 glycosylhydrolase [Clostridiales bacterium]